MRFGDHIILHDDLERQTFTVEILDRKEYPDFKTMIIDCGLNDILPDVQSIEDGVAMYHSFPGYENLVRKHGAVALYLNVVKSL